MGKNKIFCSLIEALHIWQTLNLFKGPLAHDGHIHLLVKIIIARILHRTKLVEPVNPMLTVCQIAIHGDTAIKIDCHPAPSFLFPVCLPSEVESCSIKQNAQAQDQLEIPVEALMN